MTKQNGNASALDKAISKSRNKEQGIVEDSLVDPPGDDQSLATLATEGLAIEHFDPSTLVELARSGNYEVGQRILELKEGMMVRGQLLGRGPDADILDIVTHQPKKVGTWRMLLNSGAPVSFLTTAQLDRQLPDFVGRKGETVIARGGMVKSKSNRNVAEFYVLGPKSTAPRFVENPITMPVTEIVEVKQ